MLSIYSHQISLYSVITAFCRYENTHFGRRLCFSKRFRVYFAFSVSYHYRLYTSSLFCMDFSLLQRLYSRIGLNDVPSEQEVAALASVIERENREKDSLVGQHKGIPRMAIPQSIPKGPPRKTSSGLNCQSMILNEADDGFISTSLHCLSSMEHPMCDEEDGGWISKLLNDDMDEQDHQRVYQEGYDATGRMYTDHKFASESHATLGTAEDTDWMMDWLFDDSNGMDDFIPTRASNTGLTFADIECQSGKPVVHGKYALNPATPMDVHPLSSLSMSDPSTSLSSSFLDTRWLSSSFQNHGYTLNPHAHTLSDSIPEKTCANCGCRETPSWRRLLLANPDRMDKVERVTLCNACGLYQKLHKVPRPWFVDQKTGRVKVYRPSKSKKRKQQQV